MELVPLDTHDQVRVDSDSQCETESADKKIFDNILNNKDTVKLSLTPTTVNVSWWCLCGDR